MMPKDRTKRTDAAKSTLRLIAAFVLVQVGLIITRADAPQPPPLEDLVRQASYVLVGTVLKLKTVTGASIPASNRAAVVLVNEVLYERRGLPDLTGKEITIELSRPKSVKVGQQGAFFTSGGQIGETITVREVGHLDAVDNRATLRQRVAGIIQQQIDENVQRRIASADLIVVGKLVKIEPADVPGPGTRDAPAWYEAEIEIQSVEKGLLPGKKLSFLFARSLEIKPEKALRLTSEREPGLAKEQEGIWILHRNEVPRLGISDRYTAAVPIDFQSQDRLPRIRQLIKAAQAAAGRH
jgi:hypothetical protein